MPDAPRLGIQKRLTYDSLKVDQEGEKAIIFEFCDEETPQEKPEELHLQGQNHTDDSNDIIPAKTGD